VLGALLPFAPGAGRADPAAPGEEDDVRPAEALARVDLFQGLPREVIDDLVQRGTTRSVGAGHPLVTQGSPDSGLQLLLSGSATVLVNGVERATIGEGDYFGEISLIDAAPRSATVVAGPDGVQTFAVSPLAFSSLLEAHPGISRTLLSVLTARIRRIEAANASQPG
jgi:CRP-like cAMP-binding protein